MFRKPLITMLLTALVLGLSLPAQAGISKVAKSLNLLSFAVGFAQPQGTYDQIGFVDFVDYTGRPLEVDAEDVFDPTFFLSIKYGQLKFDHLLTAVGFTYTHVNTDDTLWLNTSWETIDPNFNQYDLDLDLCYYPISPIDAVVAPYVGLGLHGGLNVLTAEGYESESEVTLAMGLNFGADFSLWTGQDKRTMLALSSVNEYQFLASDARPRYLNIGAAIKYYFRP